MVAFGASVLVALLLMGVAVAYSRRRPVGAPLTWGEAMVAAVFTYFLMFWVYGVVPHQWLIWAENQMQWTKAKLVFGPGGILKPYKYGGHSPITLTYRVVSDSIAAIIYGIAIGLQVGIWMMWQNRGKKKAGTQVEVSKYGRPLVREGAR